MIAPATIPRRVCVAITVWRQHLEGRDVAQSGSMLRDAGLEIVSPMPRRILSRRRPIGIAERHR